MWARFDYRMLRDMAGAGRRVYVVFDEEEKRKLLKCAEPRATNKKKLAYEHIHHSLPNGGICALCYCIWEDTVLVLECVPYLSLTLD